MEDISRELEREIARAKPTPYKKSREKRILVVDEFGGIKPGGYFKKLIVFLFFTTVFSVLSAGGLYFLYGHLSGENRDMRSRIARLEQKLATVTREKEVMMARLVISGKEPVGQSPAAQPAEKEKKSGIKEKSVINVATIGEQEPYAAMSEADGPSEPEVAASAAAQAGDDVSVVPVDNGVKKVTIEKFTVSRDDGEGDILVRFDIRNVSEAPGEVSGRIFTILKPEHTSQESWLVVPPALLDNGMPAQYRKGQYFSISHFKPVKFRIQSPAGVTGFKRASVYIYNDQGTLMFQDDISIDEADQG